jgi:polar amino acid transport system substrate-binding protein
MKRFLGGIALAATLLTSTAAVADGHANTTWNRIMERGVIIVGVKADTRPWGYRDQDGSIIGMEADMAQQVADTLGVELELVAVESSNRMQFLEGGRIDLLIATMSDRADRREIVGIVGPNYYSSGTNVMTPIALGVTAWSDLADRPVCGKQGAFYNQIVEERHGAQVIAFGSNAEALQALRDQRCVAWVYDDSSIAAELASGQYDDFEMPLVSEDNNPWALAVPIDEVDGIFGRFMSGMQYNWHQSGELIALEEKWGIQSTDYLAEQNARFADWLAE